jgi:tetratricopeptide (TPR) repeat protein
MKQDIIMAGPELAQRQHSLLRSLRQANVQRTSAESDAESRCKADREATDSALSLARQSANGQLAEAHKIQEQAETALAQAGLQHLLGQTRLDVPISQSDADPAQELVRSVDAANAAIQEGRNRSSLQTDIEAWQKWQETIRSRRRIMTSIAATTLLFILGVAVVLGYQMWRNNRLESLYQTTAQALNAGEWERARTTLQELFSIDNNYKDTQTLLRESYYRPAATALETEQWEKARSELQTLISMDSDYKDAQTLLRESYYRPAVMAFQAGQWKKAQVEAQGLLSLDNNYKNVATMLCESYYRSAIVYSEATEKEKAQAELEELLRRCGNYHESIELLKEFALPQMLSIKKVDSSSCAPPCEWAIDGNTGTQVHFIGSNRKDITSAWFELILDRPAWVTQIQVYPRESTYWDTAINTATLLFSDGSTQSIQLGGQIDWYKIDLKPVLASSVRIKVVDLHVGGIESNTGVSWIVLAEVALYGYQ